MSDNHLRGPDYVDSIPTARQQSPEATVGACTPVQHHPEYLAYQALQEDDRSCD